MTAEEVLRTVATLPSEDWVKIQTGIAEMLSARLSDGDLDGIRLALAEAEAEFRAGDGCSGDEVRRRLGLA